MSSKRHALTAIIYNKRGIPLAIGKNSYIKTHPLQAKAAKSVGEPYKVFLHAEIAALIRLKDPSKAHKIVISRFNADNSPANAAPCPSCLRMIKQSGINIIEHT